MGVLVGFDSGDRNTPAKPGDGPSQDKALYKANFWMFVWSVVATIAFALQTIGCLASPLRFFYVADFRGLRFAFFGICNTAGDQKCTPSLLKQTFEIASEIGTAQNTAADVQRLQNDITFAPSGLSIFALLITVLWSYFWDNDEDIMLYYLWWFSMSWVTGIALAFNAAWMNSFGTSALKHSQALSNTDVTIGVVYIILGWVQWFAILSAGLIQISYRSDLCDKVTTAGRQSFKQPYLDTLKPKSEVRMKIVQDRQDEKAALAAMQLPG